MASRDMATSFGGAADAYEAGRPDYPLAAVEWMLPPRAARALRVADVGAGTGKLARVVAETGADVVAIDPDPQMLATLRRERPGIPTFIGTAEQLPLPDDSVDAVVAGQAWHWVDPARASAEAGRVLRPGGVLGLVWNIRDDRVDWVRRMTRIVGGSHAEQMLAAGGPQIAPPFAAVERAEWRWSRPMTRARLLMMARSRSAVITAPEAEQVRIAAELGILLDEIGGTGEAVVDLPYVTHAFRAATH